MRITSNAATGKIVFEVIGTGGATNVGPSTTPGFAITNLVWSRTLFVDAEGNDLTALRGDASKPWSNVWVAAAAAVSGDTVFLRPGTFNVGTNQVKLPHGVHLKGSGWASKISSTLGYTTNGPAINPGSESELSDFEVVLPNRGSYMQVGIGMLSTVSTPQYFTNAFIDRVKVVSERAALEVDSPTVPCSWRIRNSYFEAKQTALAWYSTGLCDVAYCTLIADMNGATESGTVSGGFNACVISDMGSNTFIYACNLIATNALQSVGLFASGPNAVIRQFGGTTRAAGTNTAGPYWYEDEPPYLYALYGVAFNMDRIITMDSTVLQNTNETLVGAQYVKTGVIQTRATNVASMLSGRYTNDHTGLLDGITTITAANGSASLQRTVLLFSAVAYPGRESTYFDGSKTAGNASSNLWLKTAGSETINGGPTITNISADNGGVTLVSDGSGLRIKCAHP